MKKIIAPERKKGRDKEQIGFRALVRIFKFDVLKHFLLTTICTLLIVFITSNSNLLIRNSGSLVETGSGGCCGGHGGASHELNEEKNSEHEAVVQHVEKSGDYLPLFGKNARFIRLLGKSRLPKNEFVVFWVSLVIIYSVVKYRDYVLENGIALRSSLYLKNKVLAKFRRLPFEEKNKQKDEVKTVAEIDAGVVGESWCHLYNHAYHSSLSIIASVWFNFNDLLAMNRSSLLLSTAWILLINVVYIFMLNRITKKEEESKEQLTREIAFIDKEVAKSILIESMGLSSHYQQLQREETATTTPVRVTINKLSSLNYAIYTLLVEIYLYIIIASSKKPFTGPLKNYALVMMIAHNFGEVLLCLREYPAYKASLTKLNKFLALAEKNENLDKPSLEAKQVKEVSFQNVNFKYENDQDLLLKDYNRVFTSSQINNLAGSNGTGKSTIIYLLLGMLKPLSGKITVTLQDGSKLDLNNEVNLQTWKEDVVAFCSHDNLVENGSTGQRQIASIKEVLAKKPSAKIFIFDEASNALDSSKQLFLENNINKLLDDDKIIVFVKH